MSKCFLPVDVKNAVIQVCGRSFYYKRTLFDMFNRAGISENTYSKHASEYKFNIARLVIGDLEELGEDGWLLQRKLLTELCKLRDVADPEVSDRESGLEALRKLKSLAVQHDLIAEEQNKAVKERSAQVNQQTKKALERESRLRELQETFLGLFSSVDSQQKRGYELELLLSELFKLYQIPYRKAYKTEGEQIDGSFQFGGIGYIVEARWRKETPSLQDLLSFKGKVDRKIAGTRGLFVSIMGFQPDTINNLRQAGPANLILMDGLDLTLVLEGQIDLKEGLRAKVDKASQEGVLFYPLAGLFR